MGRALKLQKTSVFWKNGQSDNGYYQVLNPVWQNTGNILCLTRLMFVCL